VQHTYRPQTGLKRRRPGGFNRQHAAFVGGLVILAAFELLLASKGWAF